MRAERLLGRELNVAGGRLGAADKSADAVLQRLIGDILAQGALEARRTPVAAALPRKSGRPLVAYGIPVVRSAHDVLQQARAVVIIIDPDEHREPADIVLQHTFNLTRAEIRIARGEDLKQIAAREGISVATARAQLKSVMAKSDTHRQSELVAVLARLLTVGVSDGEAGTHQPTNSSRE
jgi:DNA-binding CsgD family transcriptional regulator